MRLLTRAFSIAQSERNIARRSRLLGMRQTIPCRKTKRFLTTGASSPDENTSARHGAVAIYGVFDGSSALMSSRLAAKADEPIKTSFGVIPAAPTAVERSAALRAAARLDIRTSPTLPMRCSRERCCGSQTRAPRTIAKLGNFHFPLGVLRRLIR